ncbi:hypothetical protein [Asticcacaulis sp.]|uniref:virion core protein, T7 gp14 family n=1 Tax=Asticcacaulis sp. TaxID=1872648 RepID=UPI0031D6003A
MALTSAIMSTAGLVSSAAGAYSQASGQKAALNSEAMFADLAAARRQQQARQTLEAGNAEAQAVMLDTARAKGAQRTAFATNGVDLTSESAQGVLTATDFVGQVDKNTVLANAMRDAWGLRTEATNETNRANMARTTARGISPTKSAVSTLLGGAGQVADSWYKTGAFTKKKTGTS